MERIHTPQFKLENNKLAARFVVNHKGATTDKAKRCQSASQIFVICGLVNVQLKADVNLTTNFKVYIMLNFKKCYQEDTMEYILKISSPQLKISDKYVNINNVMDCLLFAYDSAQAEFIFEMSIVLNVKASPKFSSLHDDTESVDIEFIGDDGSIALHRLVLACHSSVMKTMLTGEWKEAKEGRVNVPGMSVQALEHLKNYLYLDNLPYTSSEIEPLLDFACRYMMTDFMQLCSTKILFNITNQNAMHYMELAMKYKLKKLLFGILKLNQDNSFDLQKILSSYCGNGWMV